MKQEHHSCATGYAARQEVTMRARRGRRIGRLLLVSVLSLFATAALALPPLPPGMGLSIVRVFGTGSTGWATTYVGSNQYAYQWPFVPPQGIGHMLAQDQCEDIYVGPPDKQTLTGRQAVAVRSPYGPTSGGVTMTVTAHGHPGDPVALVTLCNRRTDTVEVWPWLEFADVPKDLTWNSTEPTDSNFTIESSAPYGPWTGVAGTTDQLSIDVLNAPATQEVAQSGPAMGKATIRGQFKQNGPPPTAVFATFAHGPRYYLRNANAKVNGFDYCLSIGPTTEHGAQGRTDICVPDPNRIWQVAQVGGNEYILQLQDKALCLDLYYESTNFGAPVVSGRCTAHDSQRWYRHPIDVVPVHYQLRNANSGFCLDVENHSIARYARVTQGTCDVTSRSQWWYLMDAP